MNFGENDHTNSDEFYNENLDLKYIPKYSF
jgi:hypothetical protein